MHAALRAVSTRSGVPIDLLAAAVHSARHWHKPHQPALDDGTDLPHFAPLHNAATLRAMPHGHARDTLEYAARYGFSTAYTGPRLATWADNHPSCYSPDMHSHLLHEMQRNTAEHWQIDVTEIYMAEPTLPAIVSKLAIVPKSTPGKYRPIFDGSCYVANCINDYINTDAFPAPRCTTAAHVRAAIIQARKDYPSEPIHLVVADISDAYRRLPLRATCWFQLTQVFDGRVYWHTANPFGVRPAAAHLWMATEPILHAIHADCGVMPLMYVDDSMTITGASHSSAAQASVKRGFTEGGFPLSPKVDTSPATRRKYIGWIWDTVENTQRLPPSSLTRIRDMLSSCSNATRMLHSRLSTVLGVLTHAAQGARHLSSFLSELHNDLARAAGQRWVKLSPEGRLDIRLWSYFLDSFSGSTIIELPPPFATAFTDACTSWGYGWYAPSLGLFGRGQWPPALLHLHINCLELIAAIVCLFELHQRVPPGSHIHIRADNTSAIYDLNTGRGKHGAMARITRTLCYMLECLTASPSLPPSHSSSHIKGLDNTVADALSRNLLPAELTDFQELHTPEALLISIALCEMPWETLSRGTTMPRSEATSYASSPPTASPPHTPPARTLQ